MMLKALCRSLPFVCPPDTKPTTAADYGVGFHLSLDYGVASIHFQNGSEVDVAKVEGGPQYKQAMRASDVVHDLTEPHIGSHWTDSKSESAGKQRPLSTSSEDQSFWRSGNDTRAQSVADMLETLKTAIESYLDSRITAAEIVLPFPVSASDLDILRTASSAVSLQQPLSAQPPAGILAARAYGMYVTCDDGYPDKSPDETRTIDMEQLILTIDYSRAALTALLVDEECGVYEYRRLLHDPRLGLDGRSDSKTYSSDLESALRSIVELPLRDGNGAGLTRISNLALSGESANDSLLHDTIERIFREQYSRFVEATAGKSRSSAIEPLFAASRGVARDCWDRLNYGKDDESSVST